MVLLYMVTWIPSIYPLYVSIYTIHGSYGVGDYVIIQELGNPVLNQDKTVHDSSGFWTLKCGLFLRPQHTDPFPVGLHPMIPPFLSMFGWNPNVLSISLGEILVLFSMFSPSPKKKTRKRQQIPMGKSSHFLNDELPGTPGEEPDRSASFSSISSNVLKNAGGVLLARTWRRSEKVTTPWHLKFVQVTHETI